MQNVPLISQLFKVDTRADQPTYLTSANNDTALDPTNANQIAEVRKDKFRRELGIRQEEVRELHNRQSIENPGAYLTSKRTAKESIINALEGIYNAIVLIHLSAGETEEAARAAAADAVLPSKNSMYAALKKIYPDDAELNALNIRSIKYTADQLP